MSNLSTKLSPLYSLLTKQVRWSWGPKEDTAFQIAKRLQADSLLVHFDSTKPLVLACGASQYVIGAVLSHVMDDGNERPIAFMSRTLNSAEKKYSQLDKEGLAIIFEQLNLAILATRFLWPFGKWQELRRHRRVSDYKQTGLYGVNSEVLLRLLTAHSECWTGEITPIFCKLFNSSSTLCFNTKGTFHGL